jgi:hypothetical protein
MTEASVTQDLLKHLKAALPGAVVFKISDRFTTGIPDICVNWKGHTTWLEIKLLKKGGRLETCSPALQQLTMRNLHRESQGGAWYVVYDARGRQKAVTIYEPRALTVTEDVTYPFVHLRSTGFDHASVVDFVRNNKS